MKKLVLLAAVLFVMWAVPSFAQVAGTYETITPGNTATKLTVAKYAPTTGEFANKKAVKALITVKSNAIHWTLDGTTPTQSGGTNIGMYTGSGQSIEIDGNRDISRFICIDETAGAASTIRVTYFFQ